MNNLSILSRKIASSFKKNEIYFKVIVVPVMEKFSLSRSIKAVNAMYECASLSMTKRIGLATEK